MNQTPPTRTSLRAFLRECLCDRDAGATVVKVAAVVIGAQLVYAGLQLHEDLLTATGAIGLALPFVLAWIRYDPDAPKSAHRRPWSAAVPGEIARMTDDEFDRLLDEVQEQMPASRRRTRRRHPHPRPSVRARPQGTARAHRLR